MPDTRKSRIFFVFAVFSILFLTSSYPAFAVPGEIWLTFGEDASSEMVVSWADSTQQVNAAVEYGTSASYGNSANFNIIDNMGGDMGFVYHTMLTDLDPDTVYHYRIKSDAGIHTDDFTFKTSPIDPCAPFSFVAMGDNRSQLGGSAFGASYLNDILSIGAQFMINTGDLVKNGDELGQWVEHMGEITPTGRYVPIMPAIGNHDDGPGDGNYQHFTRLFHTPGNNDDGNRSYYSFEYGNAFFAVVTNHDGSASAQAAWLDEQLEATDAMWKFVVIHEPFLTCPALFGLLGHPPDEAGVGAHYFPVFARHHVDIVFAGHNHMYELFKPYNGSSFVDDPGQGTLYITTGGAAEAEAIAMLIEPSLMCDGRIHQSDNIHFTNITIVGDTLAIDFWPRGRFGNQPGMPENHYFIDKATGLNCFPNADGDEDEPVDGDGDDAGEEDIVDAAEEDSVEDGDLVEDIDTPDEKDGEEAGPDGDMAEGDGEAVCIPGQRECAGSIIMKCDESGTGWMEHLDCSPRRCIDGSCVGGGSTTPPGSNDDGCSSAGGSAAGLSLLLLAALWLVRRRMTA